MTRIKHKSHQVSPLKITEMAVEALWSNKLRSGLHFNVAKKIPLG